MTCTTTSCSTLILFARLVFTLLDYADTSIVSKTSWINRLVCLLLSLQLFLLKMHAHPSGYLFNRDSIFTFVSNEAMHGFRFLFRDAEEKKEVMCYVLSSY